MEEAQVRVWPHLPLTFKPFACDWLSPAHSFCTLFIGAVTSWWSLSNSQCLASQWKKKTEKAQWTAAWGLFRKYVYKAYILHCSWIFSMVRGNKVVHTIMACRDRCLAPFVLNLGVKWRWVVKFMLCLLYLKGKSICCPLNRGWVDTRAIPDVLEETESLVYVGN